MSVEVIQKDGNPDRTHMAVSLLHISKPFTIFSDSHGALPPPPPPKQRSKETCVAPASQIKGAEKVHLGYQLQLSVAAPKSMGWRSFHRCSA